MTDCVVSVGLSFAGLSQTLVAHGRSSLPETLSHRDDLCFIVHIYFLCYGSHVLTVVEVALDLMLIC